jgi:molybdopterin-binding protein
VRSNPVITEINARTKFGQNVCALVSTKTAQTMGIQAGDTARFSFKALSVILNTL